MECIYKPYNTANVSHLSNTNRVKENENDFFFNVTKKSDEAIRDLIAFQVCNVDSTLELVFGFPFLCRVY